MSESLEEPESEFRLVNLAETIVVSRMAFSKGTVFYMNHQCGNPGHQNLNGGVTTVLVITVTDAVGKLHTLIVDKENPLVEALTNMDTYYHIKKILEIDN